MMRRIAVILTFLWLAGCSDSRFDVWKADQLASFSQKAKGQATRLYQRAIGTISSSPQKDAVRLKLARLYFKSGLYQEAIDQLRACPLAEAQKLLAISLFKNSDFTGALDVFNRIGEKPDAEYLYFYGQALEKSNLYDQALRIYSLIKGNRVFETRARERLEAINLLTGKNAYAGVSDEVRDIIRNAPAAEKYPEAGVLYLGMDENFYLTEDNRMISDSHYVIKILNDRGKENFGEVTVTYDSTYEKLELEYARTIRPDGTVVTVGEKNIRDVSLYMNYPLYSNARARIISMPEMSVGSVIEYKVKLSRSQLPNKKDFNTTYWLQADEPIIRQRCAINIPKTRTLRYKIINAPYNTFGYDMNPRVVEEGDRRIFSFEFQDVPQIIPELGMPPLSRIDPYVLFSTFESWEDIYAWWRGLYTEKISADEEIKAKVRELVEGKKTQEERLRAIYNFCAQEIRYVAVEYGDAGYEPHKATEIFQNKYGDCKDKAILLISMLSEAGIEAYPVLISTLDSLDVQRDMPFILFNHAIAVTRLDEKLVFMDVTGNTVSFSDLPIDDQDRLTLVFFKDQHALVQTPLFPPEHNSLLTRMTMSVNADESIDAERRIEASGAYQQAQRYWLKFTMPILIEEGLKAKVRTIADSAELKGHEIKNVDDLNTPVSLQYSFHAPQYFIKAGTSRIMDQLSVIDTSGLVKESRRYPIESAGLNFEEQEIEIELPPHLAVKYLPPVLEVDTPWFYFVRRYEILGDRKIRFYSADKQKTNQVAVQEYPAYKKAIEDMASTVNQHVVLEEVKSSHAKTP